MVVKLTKYRFSVRFEFRKFFANMSSMPPPLLDDAKDLSKLTKQVMFLFSALLATLKIALLIGITVSSATIARIY